ncbi:acyltransferase [Nocardioides aquiterrae]|uniref:Acyltransferase 3 domain-containing protein n=1 Tax=Nocardioides aquiterrae TaxID=203799 RepID=A0ABP4F1Q3_9ACTN
MLDRAHDPALDGVRGLAILLVLGQHAPTRPLIDGFVGVTVFFCLSGYLITTLLVRELQGGTIEVRAFYGRRAARIVPALVTVVVVTTAVLLVVRRDLATGQVLAPAGAAVTYTTSLFDWSNHVFVTGDYFNYTWSLSVEEQFYLVWPFALLWGYRRHRRGFVVAAAALATLCLALSVYLGVTRAVRYDQHEYFGTDVNALPILAGALLAIAVHHGRLSWTPRRAGPAALAAVVLLPLLAHHDDTDRPALVTLAGTALTLVILAGVGTAPRSAVRQLLASRPMRWLGERSYSIYLWNVLARIAALALLGHTLVGDAAWVALFVALSEASFRFVERPLRAALRPGGRSAAAPGSLAVPVVEVRAELASKPPRPPLVELVETPEPCRQPGIAAD